MNMEPSHPGMFIKRSILPDALSVGEAAEFLKVARPTLSKLLNGKASLSPEMALRIETAFDVRAETLLRMQARYDAYFARQNFKPAGIGKYY